MSTALSSTPARKTERLDVRLRPDVKTIIEQAAAVLGISTTDFASSALVAEAQAVLERHRRLVLGNADRDRFLEALDADAEPNEALVQAAQDYHRRCSPAAPPNGE